MKYDKPMSIKLKINPQNKNGATIRGILFPKNVFMSQTLPSDRAPESIRNKSTPILNEFPII